MEEKDELQEKDGLNIELEDIIREFSEMSPEEKLAQHDSTGDTIPIDDLLAVLKEPSLNITEEEAKPKETEEEIVAADAVTDETKDFAVATDDTKQFDAVKDETKSFATQEEIPAEEKPEKVRELIRLRTPFQIMRRKIVEGPERQYYALREQGTGKLQTVLFLSFLVAAVSVAASLFYALGQAPEDRLRLMIFGQLLMMLFSAFLGAYQMVDGLFLIFRLRFRPNTLLFFTFIACLVDGIFCLQTLRVPCCSVFCVQVVMSLWGTCMDRKTRICRTDTMRGAKMLSGIGVKEDYYEGTKGLVRCEGDVDHFMAFYGKEGPMEKLLGTYCFIALLASLVVLGVVGAFKGFHSGIQVFAAAILTAMPATMLITLERPAQLLERKFYKLGVVLCGWKGVKGLCGKAYFPITHQDLFPEGTVKLNGVKFYGQMEPATVVSYAAAVVSRENGSLSPVFAQLKESYNGQTYALESFKSYAGGIGGGVEGCVVLVGTLPMLKALEVEIPGDIRLTSGIGVAIDGVFSCLVAVNYEVSRAAAHGIRVLCGYGGLKPVLVSDDFVLTGAFLKKKFGINPKKLGRPDPESRSILRDVQIDGDDPVLSLAVRPTLAAYGYSIVGARALHLAIILGVIIHILGGVLGIGAIAVLGMIGETGLLTPLNLLLYQAVWMVPGLLVTEWTRVL